MSLTHISSSIINFLSEVIVAQGSEGEDVKPNIAGPDPIHIDATSKILELFMSLLPPGTRQSISNVLTFQQCQGLLAFTEQYQCPQLIPLVRARLPDSATERGQPASLFLLASLRDDWPLGRAALRIMDTSETTYLFWTAPTHKGKREPKYDSEVQGRAFFEKLRPEWSRVLMSLIFFGTFNSHNTQLASTNWKDYADRFVQPVNPPKRKSSSVMLCLF